MAEPFAIMAAKIVNKNRFDNRNIGVEKDFYTIYALLMNARPLVASCQTSFLTRIAYSG